MLGLWKAEMLYAFLILPIVFTELLFLYGDSVRNSRGYFFRAITRSSLFLFISLGLRWLVGAAIVASLPGRSQGFPAATIIGFLLVMAPHGLEGFLTKRMTEKSTQRVIVKMLTRLHILTLQIFRHETQGLKERDNYDCQHLVGWWRCELTQKEVERNIRATYEYYKREIANKRRNPVFMKSDVDTSAGQKFYPLVAHLGRNGLRRRLRNPHVFVEWDGSERRRKTGSKTARKNPDPNPDQSRCYDNEVLMRQIAKGKAFAE